MKRGTIVLTPFPFTDLSGKKVRPGVIVSRSDRPGGDVVLAFITSRQALKPLATDLVIDSTHPDFVQTGLKGNATIKLDKLATVATSILHGELGELSAALVQEMDARLRYALEL
jgi:mRNA interferase MazF